VSAGRSRAQRGQAIVLLAVGLIALLAGVGLAFDAGFDYYYSVAAQRAAAAAALAGVVCLPNQFTPAQANPAGFDATDRAIAEARRNGFDVNDTADHVTVTPTQIAGQATELQVTVSRNVPTLLMQIFGIPFVTVTQQAVASYLPPISIGQTGGQQGSTVSQLGTGDNYYFMRTEGWAGDRGTGDAYTPNPAYEYGGTLSPASTDVHQISAQNGTDTVDSNLPARGGYNYLITLPASGYSVQVYNAAFAPDGNGGKAHDYCENSKSVIFPGFFLGAIGPCSSGGNYYYHEEDSVNFSDKTTFDAMQYTLFRVNSTFVRSSDVELSKMTVLPIDASNWSANSGQYTNVNTGGTITQGYNFFTGQPTNMAIYHNWINVANYNGSQDGGLVVNQTTDASALAAGTYRLRVDTLSYNGTNPPGNGVAHKAYAVRVVDSSGNVCGTCVSAWDDMCYYTPITTTGGGSFTIPLFSLPQQYAGYTVYVDVFDPGDISGGGNVDINILTPSGAIATPTPPQTVLVQDLGTSRGSTSGATVIGNQATATFRATSAGNTLYNGHWVELLIPVPSNYSPGTGSSCSPSAGSGTWCLQYATSNGVTATDTVSVTVGLQGNPSHLIIG
jgi:hypothetical protein